MKHSQSGFGAVAFIGILAVIFVGGTAVYLSQAPQESDATPEVSPAVDNESSVGSRETDSEKPEGRMVTADFNLETKVESGMASEGTVIPLPGDITADEVDSREPATDTSVTPNPGTFEAYSPEKLSRAETGDVVLFFHASWCPSCRALESDINANLSQIPDGVHLLRVDYDSETELKKKYGVVRQHTLVQVDANGSQIKTLTGLNNTLAQVVSQL